MNTKVTEPIIEIYLEHLRQGNINAAKGVREELYEWEKRAEQQYPMRVSPAPKILSTNDEQKALNEILNDGKIRKYCDYRGHEKLTGLNPMFVKKIMIHRYGLDFCSRACREAYARKKGYKDGNQQLDSGFRVWKLYYPLYRCQF